MLHPMLDALSLLTVRAWFNPRRSADQLVRRFDLKTVLALYTLFACVTALVSQLQLGTSYLLVLLGYLLAPVSFLLLTRWVAGTDWATLAKVTLLGFVVTAPLSLLSSISVSPPVSDEPGRLALLSVLGFFYLCLTVWIVVIQLRLYGTLLGLRKRTVFAVLMTTGLVILIVNLLLLRYSA